MSRFTMRDVARLAGALAIAAAGGAVFNHFHMPLAWMLGAMTACGLAAVMQVPVNAPQVTRTPMTVIIGTMLGSSFRPELLHALGEWIIPLLGLVVYLPLSSTVCNFYFRKVGGIDSRTAAFCSTPGGLVEMVVMGARHGADERTVALIHSARIFLVVLLLPFFVRLTTGAAIDTQGAGFVPLSAVGAEDVLWFVASGGMGLLLGKALRLPAKFLLGPMLASAIFHATGLTDFVLPTTVIAIAQIVMGATIGCRFMGTSARRILSVLAISVGSTLLLLAIAMGMAQILALASGIPFNAILLAYAPGGLAEMSLVALSLGLEVPFVVAHHMTRIFLVVVGMSFWLRREAG